MLFRNCFRLIACASALLISAVCVARVRTGVEVLRDSGFKGLEGRRVGLLTNPSGVDASLKSTIDIFVEAPQVNLVALYAPEHGVRGEQWAGGYVAGGTDAETGLPVFSLYGPNRQPSADMLKGIDIMVYDIQDVGSRSYTFISTLGLVMRSCAELGIEVMVLDRPNPLGGLKIEGPCPEPGFHSFVGQYRIPYIYGLTVGELAMMINEEGLNRGQKGDLEPLKCKLSVIPMEGWTRDMLFEDTELPWILPSPNIPTAGSAVCYPAAGLVGEFNGYLNIGIGYTLPFGTFAAEWIDAASLKEKLESYNLPGIAWRTIHYKPFSGSCAGILIHGVQYFFTDYEAAEVTLTQFYVMRAVWELYGRNPFIISPERMAMFDKVSGSDWVRLNFGVNMDTDALEEYWGKDVEQFRELSSRYHLY